MESGYFQINELYTRKLEALPSAYIQHKQSYIFLIMSKITMFIVIPFVKSKKLSGLGEDGSDKLLQAASDRWERHDYSNIDVTDSLRLVDLKHLA